MLVIVNPGRVVDDGKTLHKPNGDPFEMDDGQAEKLIARNIVSPAQVEHDAADKERQLVEAIDTLDSNKANNDHWTNSEKPQTRALADIIGVAVSAAERDAAYKVYLEEHGEA